MAKQVQFTVSGNDGNSSAVEFYGGTYLRFASGSHYAKDANFSTYAQNVVDAMIASGWLSAPGGGGGSGKMECSAAGAVITIVQTPGCPKTHITTKDGDDNSDDFSPAGQIDFLEPATAVPGAGPMMKVAN